MDFLLGAAVVALGLLVGTLLTTAVARVPGEEALLRPASRCRACSSALAATEQTPVLSWLLLRGRCRVCGARIPGWYPAVEAGTALLFGLTYAVVGASWILPALLFLATLSVAATAIDLQHHRLPDAIVLPSYPIMLALLVVAVLGPGTWSDLLRALMAGVALFLGYLMLALINPSGLGGGDVKLAGVLGLILGWAGWPQVLVGGLAGFFLGAIAGAVLLLARRVDRTTAIPFGPFMFAGAYLGLMLGPGILDWYVGS